jgi:hypothetical protein
MKRSGTTTDEDIRSSPLGFFNVAESYWAGAADAWKEIRS